MAKIDFKTKEGKEIFWHSTSHLLAQAVKRIFPEAALTIGPAIESGFYYDFDFRPFTPEDIKKIEDEMKKIAHEKLKIEKVELTKEEAKKQFKNNPYKLELINEAEGKITAYKQGEFTDLCKGPHVDSTGELKAFKLLKTSGAYWRGKSENKQLQSIYGISFPDKVMLNDYVTKLQEAEKRDHRKIGKDLELFFFNEYSPGSAFFEPNGAIIYNELVKFVREEYVKRGYKEVI